MAEMVIDLADVIFVDLAGARGLVMSKVSGRDAGVMSGSPGRDGE